MEGGFPPPFLHLIARLDKACLIAEFVGIPVTDDHLYLRCHRFVGGSRPRSVSSLSKPHLFLQLGQSDRVVVHGIPSPSPSDDGIVGRNDGRILRFVGLKEGDATGCYSGTHVRRPIGIIHLSSDLSDKALRPNAKEAIRANDIRGSIEANLRVFN